MATTSKWSEADLEKTIKARPSLLTALISGGLVYDDNEPLTIIGTQVPCIFGRIDMLAFNGGNLYVIEFKAVRAGEEVTGQLDRYRRAVSCYFPPHFITEEMISIYPELRHIPVITVAIAPSFTRQALLGINYCFQVDHFDPSTGALEMTRLQTGYPHDQKAFKDLEKLLEPYYYNLLRREMSKRQKEINQDSIQYTSALHRLSEVN